MSKVHGTAWKEPFDKFYPFSGGKQLPAGGFGPLSKHPFLC